jgi:hypothetical protein
VTLPWTLFRKGALVLFGSALLLGFGASALFMGHRLPVESWRVLFVLALVVLTICSAVVIPGVLLPNIRSPHPEFLSDDLQDEWHDLRERRLGRPHLLMLGAALAGLIYLWCIFYYGKMSNAFWFGWLPVGVAAILLALLLFAFVRRTPWYNDRYFRTPNRVIVIAFTGYALAQFLGISMTERPAPALGDPAPVVANIDYGYVGTRAYTITNRYLEFGLAPDVTIPDCDDDACGYLFLVILFLLLTFILVAGAALIPHMWVLSCLVLLTLIALLVLHDVRRDRNVQVRYG